MAPARTPLSSTVCPRKQLCACRAYAYVWDAFNVTDVAHSTEHTAGQRKQKHNHHNCSYIMHRTTVDTHISPWLSAGTHSPHTPLQPTVVYVSADAASTSGAHTHAELLRLPSISRRRDGAVVVVVVGASVFIAVLFGASGAVVVVVVVLAVGAFVVVVVFCTVQSQLLKSLRSYPQHLFSLTEQTQLVHLDCWHSHWLSEPFFLLLCYCLDPLV
ncbi:hypothetical protein TcCL_NonESM10405 [Trypanosoma cruzi]|nr:hypothetical protein TcCL_NonESM10405 [Trypanosoma cruzi]